MAPRVNRGSIDRMIAVWCVVMCAQDSGRVLAMPWKKEWFAMSLVTCEDVRDIY